MKKTSIAAVGTAAVLLVLGQTASAHSSHLFTGGYPSSVVSNLKFVVSNAPSSYYNTNIMTAAGTAWNSISSKVYLSKNSTGAKMSIIVGSTSTNGLLGRMYPYYRNAVGGLSEDTDLNDIWEVTDCYGYENQMQAYGMNDSEKKSNFIHEIGHALSLAHVEASYSGYAVMKQGIQNLGPQMTDKDHLKLKWGY